MNDWRRISGLDSRNFAGSRAYFLTLTCIHKLFLKFSLEGIPFNLINFRILLRTGVKWPDYQSWELWFTWKRWAYFVLQTERAWIKRYTLSLSIMGKKVVWTSKEEKNVRELIESFKLSIVINTKAYIPHQKKSRYNWIALKWLPITFFCNEALE